MSEKLMPRLEAWKKHSTLRKIGGDLEDESVFRDETNILDLRLRLEPAIDEAEEAFLARSLGDTRILTSLGRDGQFVQVVAAPQLIKAPPECRLGHRFPGATRSLGGFRAMAQRAAQLCPRPWIWRA